MIQSAFVGALSKSKIFSEDETISSTNASTINSEDRTDYYGTVSHQRNVPEIF